MCSLIRRCCVQVAEADTFAPRAPAAVRSKVWRHLVTTIQYMPILYVQMGVGCACACACAHMRACVCACVRVCVRARALSLSLGVCACMCVCVCVSHTHTLSLSLSRARSLSLSLCALCGYSDVKKDQKFPILKTLQKLSSRAQTITQVGEAVPATASGAKDSVAAQMGQLAAAAVVVTSAAAAALTAVGAVVPVAAGVVATSISLPRQAKPFSAN